MNRINRMMDKHGLASLAHNVVRVQPVCKIAQLFAHLSSSTSILTHMRYVAGPYFAQGVQADIARANLLWTQYGNLRCMTTAERERLQGFPLGYTTGWTETLAAAMLGESFHVDTIAYTTPRLFIF